MIYYFPHDHSQFYMIHYSNRCTYRPAHSNPIPDPCAVCLVQNSPCTCLEFSKTFNRNDESEIYIEQVHWLRCITSYKMLYNPVYTCYTARIRARIKGVHVYTSLYYLYYLYCIKGVHVYTSLFVNFTTLFRPTSQHAQDPARNKQTLNCANRTTVTVEQLEKCKIRNEK